jgi:hypothetical protein
MPWVMEWFAAGQDSQSFTGRTLKSCFSLPPGYCSTTLTLRPSPG